MRKSGPVVLAYCPQADESQYFGGGRLNDLQGIHERRFVAIDKAGCVRRRAVRVEQNGLRNHGFGFRFANGFGELIPALAVMEPLMRQFMKENREFLGRR